MGLDTTHGCWHGAYSAFMRWRIELARAADVPLWLMDSYWNGMPYGETIHATVDRLRLPSPFGEQPDGSASATRASLETALAATRQRDPDLLAMQSVLETILPWLPLHWEQLRPDVIHVLLNHSDCDGEIAAADCGPLADRLEALLPKLPTEPGWGHLADYRAKTQQFIDGLRLAARLGEAVEFG